MLLLQRDNQGRIPSMLLSLQQYHQLPDVAKQLFTSVAAQSALVSCTGLYQRWVAWWYRCSVCGVDCCVCSVQSASTE
jgi:hypothetical protein